MNLNINEEEFNFLQCYICMQTVKKARMCPHCSKLACFQCLTNWFQQRQQHQCPHCRRFVDIDNFADCQRFINDLEKIFKKIEKRQKTNKLCRQHKLQLNYYCSDCNLGICSDCGIFSEKHKGHNITHLRKIYELRKFKILQQMSKIDIKIQQYKLNSLKIKECIQKLLIQKQKKKALIRNNFNSIQQILQNQYDEINQQIIQQYKQNEDQLQLFVNIKQQVVQNLQNYTQNQVILQANDIISSIIQLCSKKQEKVQIKNSFSSINQIIPQYSIFQYQLTDFNSQIVYSHPFIMNSIIWKLKIYPKGNGPVKQKYLSVFLQMFQGYQNDTKYEYKIQLINEQNKKQSIIRQYSSKFDIGECWGYNQFIQLQNLKKGFITNNIIKFRILIRNATYRQLCYDQKRQINNLEQEINKLQKKLIDKNNQKINECIILRQKQYQNTQINKINLENKVKLLKIESKIKKQELKLQLLFKQQFFGQQLS